VQNVVFQSWWHLACHWRLSNSLYGELSSHTCLVECHRFYAEAGLSKQEVSVHIYTSTLKIEYQDTELAFYTMEWAEDNKHIKEVKNPCVIETGYRSLQLTLWTLGPDEWLLFLKLPDYAARKKPQKKPDVIQLPFASPD